MFEFLQSISDFVQQGIYDFAQEAFKYAITTGLIAYVKAQLWGLTFAWEIGQSLLQAFNVSGQIAGAFGALNSNISSALFFFRVPESVSILLSAGATRFVMNMVPGL